MYERLMFGASIAIGATILVLCGCVSPLPSSHDSGMLIEKESDSLVNIDQFSDKITATAKTAVGKGHNPDKARELYAAAEKRYRAAAASQDKDRTKRLVSAAEDFRAAAERWPDSALEQDSLFLAGESYFFADHYADANHSFELLLKKYPSTKHLDVVETRRFAIADYWLKLNDSSPQSVWAFNFTDEARPTRDAFGNAVRIFDRIRIDDPTGRLADDATLAAGNAYFAAGRYLDADSFYTDLRKIVSEQRTPVSRHLLGMKAKLLSYQGPDYSGDCLDEAEKLIKQIKRQFPYEAEKVREEINRAYAEVRFKKAEREWHMARYYDRRGEYGAAKFYYNTIVTDFDETPHANEALARLEEIRGEPDVPEQQMEWLVKAFPTEEDVKPLIATGNSATTRH